MADKPLNTTLSCRAALQTGAQGALPNTCSQPTRWATKASGIRPVRRWQRVIATASATHHGLSTASTRQCLHPFSISLDVRTMIDTRTYLHVI